MIVIVTYEEDLAAKAVQDALARQGRTGVFWLELENCQSKYQFTLTADDSSISWRLSRRDQPEIVLTPDKISSVYWRRAVKSPGSRLLSLPTPDILDDYEMFWSVRWALEALPHDLFPLGHHLAHAKAENKHRQVAAALKQGWKIPRTCHSNDTAMLSAFAFAEGSVAIKALRVPALVRPGEEDKARHIACKSFDAETLVPRLEGAGSTQLFCQQVIKRSHDLRIMVFPSQTIAAEIDVRPLENNKLDWREQSLDLPHRIIPVDAAFDRQLRGYLAEMGLKAGYFDFAVPADGGAPVFFECNTNAQWLWIEMVTGHPIAEAIARELAGLPPQD
jgi:hypothetical protein